MRKFWNNLIKYRAYALYSAVASLKAKVSGSYFSWMWWILDPFLFMLVYSFVHNAVFHSNEPHYMAFVFIGYGTWAFFNRCVTQSVKLVRANKGILSRVYLPKCILLVTTVLENLIQYLIAIALAFIVAILDGVVFSWNLLYFPVVVLCMVLFTFGVCTIMLHIGVYLKDLSNIMVILLKLVFYMSGVFYNLNTRVKQPYGKWLCCINPVAMYINESRSVIINGTAPDLLFLGIWLLISLAISAFGIHLIQKHEQTYVKAI